VRKRSESAYRCWCAALLRAISGCQSKASVIRRSHPPLSTSNAAGVKLSIRMTSEEAARFAAGARAAGLSQGACLADLIANAGLSQGACLADLIANVPVLSAGGSRAEHIVTMVPSSAGLSTLSRNIRRRQAVVVRRA
jgi:hypothetical protein